MTTGQKPPVLLIHGMWSDADTLRELRDAFAARGYPVTAVTLPHHAPRAQHTAQSRAALGRTGLQAYVDFLVDQVRALDRPPILVGHSMGGLLAQLVAARMPCDRLVLLSSAAPAGINGLGLSVLRTLGRNLLKFPLWTQATELGLANVRYGIANAQSDVEQRDITDRCGYESGRVTFELTLTAFTRKSPADVAPGRITCPVLIIGGTEDRITPIRVQRQIARRYGDRCRLVEIPGCDHWTVGGRFFGDIEDTVFPWLDQTAAAAESSEGDA